MYIISNLCRPKVDKKAGNLPSPTLPHALHPLTVTTPVKKTHCRSKSDATGNNSIDKDVIVLTGLIVFSRILLNLKPMFYFLQQANDEPTSKYIFIFSLLISLLRYLLQDAPQSNYREPPKVKHWRFIIRTSF